MKAIHLFIHVVKQGSFSGAARYFDITPSAVSRQISQLEHELGARLFHRTTRQQNLTEAGEIYFQYALRIHEEVESAQLAVNQLSGKPAGTLRVTAERDFAETFIQPLLSGFFNRYPEIQLHLSLETNVVDLIDGAMDLAIRIGHLQDSSFVARKLMSSPSIVCASPAYIKKHSLPLTPVELQSHNCLSFRPNASQVLWRLKVEQEFQEIPVSGKLRTNSLTILRDAALKDLGIILVPKWFVQNQLDSGQLISLNFTTLETPIYAVFANSRQLAPKVRAFVDFMIEGLS